MYYLPGIRLVFIGILLSAFAACTKEEFNKVPLANAGPSQTIQLPVSAVTLNGTGSDSDGEVVAYLWSQVSGPVASVITSPGNTSTTVTGLKQGTYIFQLMVVDDEGATGVDTTKIEVLPAQPVTINLSILSENETVIADLNGANHTNNTPQDFHISRWTNGGSPYISRAAFKFDLSQIPAGSSIQSAQLYLYSYPSPTLTGNFVDANFGTDNALILQRITTSWNEAGMSWAAMPGVTTANQLQIPATNQSTLDLNLDVKSIVTDMLTSGNNGFLLRLQNEVSAYNIRIFVSGANTTHTTKHPKLVITYQ
jgi:hypothetical protein